MCSSAMTQATPTRSQLKYHADRSGTLSVAESLQSAQSVVGLLATTWHLQGNEYGCFLQAWTGVACLQCMPELRPAKTSKDAEV